MKEQNGNEKKKRLTKEKKFYLFSAIGCAAALLAVIIVAIVITNANKVDTTVKNPNSTNIQQSAPDVNGEIDEKPDNNEPVITTPEGMTMPMESVTVSNDYGFYYNKTLNHYYEHAGIDFTAEVGTEVRAVDAGVVESIYRDDVLTGTEITINHGDGVKSVYRFVNVAEGITVGTEVEKGDIIATVAEATGDEYKDGAHLHFEILKNDQSVDPATYLTFEEK